jgi:hypothetical protein
MSYAVTRGEPPSVEEIPTLEAALERAGQLVSDNYFAVAIRDGKATRSREMSCWPVILG